MSNRNRRRQRPTQQGNSLREFRFEHDGRTHVLPPASDGAANIPAGTVLDAVESGDEMSQLRLGWAMLKACGPSPEAIEALRAMPMTRFGEVIGKWMKHGGVNPGESRRSSDS